MKRAVIFVNGNLSNLSQAKKIITKEDYLIAADGGVKHIFKLGLTPNIIIGDFDSIPVSLQKIFIKKKIELIKYPRKKDKTDFELAIDYCLKNKFQEIIIFGILGDRIDHMMANIFLIIRTQNTLLRQGFGGQVKIIEGKKEIFVLNKEIAINGKIGDEVSIIPVSEKLEDVSTVGLEYPLTNETLSFGSTRSISNVMKKNPAKISVTRGTAIITHLKANSTKINKT
jgi:thiamine pyrophosphokinase